MRISLDGLFARRRRLGPVVTCAIYGLLLIAGLSYVSYKLVYTHPFQVQRRLETRLAPFLQVSPRIEGAVSTWSETRVDRIDVPARPLISERTLASFDDVRLGWGARTGIADTVGTGLGFRGRKAARAGAGLRGPRSIEVRSFGCWIDRTRDSGAGAPPRWNFEESIRTESILRELRESGVEVTLERGTVRLREQPPSTAAGGWEIPVVDVLIRSTGSAIAISAALPECAHWIDGDVEARIEETGAVALSGHIEEFSGVGSLVPYLPKNLRDLATFLEPRGAFAVDLRTLRIFGAGRKPELDLVVEHVDSSIRVGRSIPPLEHLRGKMRVLTDSVAMGEDGGVQPASCSLWGGEWTVSGSVGPEARPLRLGLASVQIRRIATSRCPPAIRDVFDWAQPRGMVRGELELSPSRGTGEDAWRIEFHLDDLTFVELPALEVGSVSAELSGVGSQGGGSIRIDRLFLSGIQPLTGTLSVSLQGSEIVVKATGVRAVPEDVTSNAESGGADIAPGETAENPGSVFGELRYRPADGRVSGEIRGSDLEVSNGLMAIERAGGNLSLSGVPPPRPAPSPSASWRAEGSWNLRTVEVRAGLAADGALLFPVGTALLAVDAAGLHIDGLRLASPTSTLRARGRVNTAGQVDLVAVLLTGDRVGDLADLPLGASPREWLEAGGAACKPFRVGGTLAEPVSRAITPADRAFRAESAK